MRLLAAILALLVLAPAASAAPNVEIRRTSHGIPHIKAKTFYGAAYGYGYAFAQDNLCEMADTYVTVNGERSRYFGPDASYESRGNGATFNNLDSDFFFQRIKDDRVVEKLLEQPPPSGPLPEIREGVRGYAAGYDAYLAEVGVNGICRRALPRQGVGAADHRARRLPALLPARAAGQLGGRDRRHRAGAAAHAGDAARPRSRRCPRRASSARCRTGCRSATSAPTPSRSARRRPATARGCCSATRTSPGTGPSASTRRSSRSPARPTSPGASLFGVPIILIGHTQNLAWSHTVSTAFRFTPFELKLVPGSPDDLPRRRAAARRCARQEVTVQARKADGTLEPRKRTLYSTEYGPMFTSLLGLPLFPWTPDVGATRWATPTRATSGCSTTSSRSTGPSATAQLDAIERRYQGIPWVNTIAADSTGSAYYADIGTVPHVTDEEVARCNTTALGTATFSALGLPVLDGSRSDCRWGSDPDAAVPGILGPARMPSLFRDDYVTNSNDSYWLSNPAHPLEGYDRIIGDERTERSLRTRTGLRIVADQLAQGAVHAAARSRTPCSPTARWRAS